MSGENNFQVRRKYPKNLGVNDDHLFAHEILRTFERYSVEKVTNAIISFPGVLHSSFKLVRKSVPSISYFSEFGVWHLFKTIVRLKKKSNTPQSLALTFDLWSNGYFHWFTDTLSRILFLKNQQLNFTLLIPSNLQPFHIESLKPLHIDNSIELHPKEYIRSKAVLFVPPIPAGNYDENIIRELRSIYRDFYRVKEDLGSDKIYITRKNAARRKVINESKVEELLAEYGFKSYAFENYTFSDQVKLVSNAKYLVGLHGAGLTNMLFMTGGSIMEFRQCNDYVNNCYFALASALELEYYYLLCTPEDNNPHHNSNVCVDIAALRMNIELMLAN